MRRWTCLLPLLLAGLATGANAIPSPLVGELSIRIFYPRHAALPDLVASGSFSATVAAPHLSSLTVPASVLQTANLIVDLTDPLAYPIEGLKATLHNQPGHFSDTGGGFGGRMSPGGVVRLCLFADCNAVFVPANLSIPLAPVGIGGISFVSSGVNITVVGAPWTTATANVFGVTQMGFAHGAASATSSTGLNSGVISLVAPSFVSTSIAPLSPLRFFGLLKLRVIPEPATLLLVAGGLAALGLGRRRLRRR